MIRKLTLTTLTLALAAACSTPVGNVETSQYAPEGIKPDAGTIAYNPHGVDTLVHARRENAFKTIYKICGGDNYTITKEETVRPERAPADIQSKLMQNTATDIHLLHYRCKR